MIARIWVLASGTFLYTSSSVILILAENALGGLAIGGSASGTLGVAHC